MKYLLDTNIVVGHLRGNRKVVRELNSILGQGLALSTVSLAELYHGAEKSDYPDKNKNLIAELVGIPEVSTLPLIDDVAREYGKLLCEMEEAGNKLAPMDTLIAATARWHGLTIFTTDAQHFSRLVDFGLAIRGI